MVKKTEKDSLYAAMDVASVWLERALAQPVTPPYTREAKAPPSGRVLL